MKNKDFLNTAKSHRGSSSGVAVCALGKNSESPFDREHILYSLVLGDTFLGELKTDIRIGRAEIAPSVFAFNILKRYT